MKRLYLSLIVFLMGLLCNLHPLYAQDTGHNYIRTRIMLDSLSARRMDAISYYDGLGRPYLSVQKQQTPSGANLATLLEYDSLGNEAVHWLPAVVRADYVEPSLLKDSLFQFYQGDSRPYKETVYEPSLLSKVSRTYQAGDAWKEHPACIEYYANCDSFPLTCTEYTVSAEGALLQGGLAAACKYTVMKSVDEDGSPVYQFTDGTGNAVLVRRMEGEVAHDTYYVYDSYDLLRYVLPPAYQDDPDADLYAYRYTYDALGRCVEKKLPGISPVRYVYDAADHLTFSQDGNQREYSQWTFYLYDAFGRLLVEGSCVNPDTASVANKVVECLVSRNADRQMTPGYGLWNTPYLPNITFPSASEHIVNYYDDYSFRSLPGFNSGFSYSDDVSSAKGKLTGSTLGFGQVLRYNPKGELAEVRSKNSLGGYDTDSYTYTFTGNPRTLVRVHDVPDKPVLRESYTYMYDNADRLTDVCYSLGNAPARLLYRNVYDELGRLQRRDCFHPSDSSVVVSSQGYAYDIRGWLSGISGDKFRQKVHYADGTGVPRYNGTISSLTWQSGDEPTWRGYTFTYDGLNRLRDAVYGEGTDLSANTHRFDEQVMGYDKMGNILSLRRYGQTGISSYGLVDDLTMSYNGNQLKSVSDHVVNPVAGTNDMEFKDGTSASAEYFYDKNGNLTKDFNKKITSIGYNYLNLPYEVQFEGGNRISYSYDKNGKKLRSTHVTNGVTITTDYCGNVIYENGVAAKLLTEVGYITLPDSVYHYFLQDHLGNNRVVVDQSGTVEEVNHYYPFGGIFASTSVQPYKYNGKELDRKNGLDWYDYGARMYDAGIGRFVTQDRFSENYYALSPYQYGANNPVNNIDVNGDSIWYTLNKNVITMHVTAKIFNNSSDNINMKRAAEDIASDIKNTYEGKFEWSDGETYNLKVDMDLQVANSMKDVENSDHLFVLADSDGKGARGATSMAGGKVMTLASSDFANNNWLSNHLFHNKTFTATHEFGHALGLSHSQNPFNIMKQRGVFHNSNENQRTIMLQQQYNINRGPNYLDYANRKIPYPFIHYNALVVDIYNLGFKWR